MQDPHEVVLELNTNDKALARSIGQEHNLIYIGPLGGLQGHYLYKYDKEKHSSRRLKRETSQLLEHDARIKMHAPQVISVKSSY